MAKISREILAEGKKKKWSDAQIAVKAGLAPRFIKNVDMMRCRFEDEDKKAKKAK